MAQATSEIGMGFRNVANPVGDATGRAFAQEAKAR